MDLCDIRCRTYRSSPKAIVVALLLTLQVLTACQSDEAPSPEDAPPERATASPPAGTPLPSSQSVAEAVPESVDESSGGQATTGRRNRAGSTFASSVELPPDPPSTLTAVEAESALDALMSEVYRLRTGVDREAFDPDAILGRTGINPDSIFRWVRSKTRPLPYRGVLKGAQGVLMDGGGNSLDRSLLLADLLIRAGYAVELANAQLTTEGLQRVEEQVLDDIAFSQRAARSAELDASTQNFDTATIERLATIGGHAPPDLVAYVQEVERRGKRLTADVLTQADRQTAALIQTAGLASGGESTLRGALPALQDHWWVVITDVDPPRSLDLYLDPEEGDPTARGLIGAPTAFAPDQLPDDLYHTVSLRVSADQWTGGQIRSREALAETFRVAELQLHSMELTFVPSGAQTVSELFDPESEAASGGGSIRARILKNLEEQTAWTPILRVKEQVYSESSIADDGSLSPARSMFGTGQALGQAVSMFEALGSADTTAGQHLVGVRLEAELTAPDWQRSHSRTLFDFRDRAGDFNDDVDLRRERAARFVARQNYVAQANAVPASYLQHLELEALAAEQGRFERLLGAAQNGDQLSLLEELLQLRPPVDPAQQLAWLRWAAPLNRAPSAVLVHPNLMASFEELSLKGRTGKVAVGLDILENQVLPLTLNADEARQANVYQGVLDTLLEDALFATSPQRINTARHFAEDLATPTAIAWKSEPLATARQLYPEATRDLDEDSSIRIVHSPLRQSQAPAEATFWRVDVGSGATLGYDATGRGGVTAEQIIIFINHAATLIPATLTAMACHEADTTGDPCAYLSCILGAAAVAGGAAGGVYYVGLNVAEAAVAAGGLIYKMLTFVAGRVVAENCG